ncbi:GGDEF domain-containing protein [Pseudomonas syringae pv. cilantro]|uniref:diguanylate cyclase n=2 Tax=Pseudomonas syringae TaxID=317 RepID=A0A0N1JMR5_PSESX|nr:GGDEF domain-containing protein [Pseudomonas syringae pv. cilantro]
MWDINLAPINDGHLPLFFIFLVSSTLLGGCLSVTFLNLAVQTMLARDTFQKLSETDPLTLAPNRRALITSLDDSLASKDRTSLWFAMLDLDNFKAINDQHGHDAGDKVLISFVQIIKTTRDVVSFGRLGGEEFGLVFSAAAATDAIVALNYLLLCAQKDDTAGFHYSCSAGMTNLATAATGNEILKNADENLYLAKRSGRKCIAFEGKVVSNTSET